MARPLTARLLKKDPLLDGIIEFERSGGVLELLRQARILRSYNFDRVYSIHRSPRTAILLFLAGIPERFGFADAHLSFLYSRRITRCLEQHEVMRNLAILSPEAKIESLPSALRLFAPDSDQLPDKLKQLITGKRYAVLVPGSAWPTKRWHWQGYRQVAEYLLHKGWQVVLTGSPQEALIAARVASGLDLLDCTGTTSVEESLLLYRHAALIVCNDSMALHVASAFKIPTVAVFCATSESFGFGPWQNRAVVVEKEGLSCKPCARHGGMSCPNGSEGCMRQLDAATVIKAIESLLA